VVHPVVLPEQCKVKSRQCELVHTSGAAGRIRLASEPARSAEERLATGDNKTISLAAAAVAAVLVSPFPAAAPAPAPQFTAEKSGFFDYRLRLSNSRLTGRYKAWLVAVRLCVV
jgi:hypothetical protein